MNKQVQISIVIPVYNMEKYINECIDSVLNQKDVALEIICINDGSIDATYDILKQYAELNSNIVVYTQENYGLSASRNKGIELAQGRYIYFLDGDDLLANEYILHDALEQLDSKELDLLELDAESFFESDEIRVKNKNYERAYQRINAYGMYENGYELLLKLLAGGDYYASSCIRIYRSSFLRKNNLKFTEGILYEDNIHTLSCFLLAGRVMHVNRTIMKRRIREGSIMQSDVDFHKFYSYVTVYEETMKLWDKYGNNLVDKQMERLCDDYKNLARYMYRMLTYHEKNKINDLAPAQRYRIKKEILDTDSIVDENIYSFPYFMFKPSEHIMLYGAGTVGKTLYRIAQRDNLIFIDGVFDKRGVEVSENYIRVNGIDEIESYKDYKWLITIDNKSVAREVKKMLLERGVLERNIKWPSVGYKRLEISRYSLEENKCLERALANIETKKIIVFMQPEHGNLGDYAISLGEKNFLSTYFHEYEAIWITTNEWIYLNEELKRNINNRDIICMNGGGYFGDVWESGITCKEICEAFPNNVKVFFPNTLTYKNQVYEDNKNLQEDIEWIRNQNQLYMFFRDTYSYEYMKNIGGINCYYSPDMALFIEPEPIERTKISGKIMMCFRNDCEKKIVGEEEIRVFLNNLGYSVVDEDIHLNKYLSIEEGYERVKQHIKNLRCYGLIITDRLHMMIMSALAGVPCIATDNSTRKISGVYTWIKSKSVKIVNSPEEIDCELVKQMLEKSYEYEPLTDEFEMMAKQFKRIISGMMTEETIYE